MLLKRFNLKVSKGFVPLLIAQFLSALADNALLFAAIALLAQLNSPQWHQPLLLQFFVISYIILAPFVGGIADAYPKGRVMFYSNAIKFIGSLSMLLGMQPLYAYAIVGVGAAAYSPAKYGILTELLPPKELVMANGWMEGSTVFAIILGSIIGGALAQFDPLVAIIIITGLYLLAAVFNRYIPLLPIDHKLTKKNPLFMIKDFWHAFKVLWKDPEGQLSLAVTTLFWGAGASLRLIVIAWASYALQFNLEEATRLTAMVAFGIAIGSVIAARYISLKDSVRVLPAGILMGGFVMTMVVINDWHIAGLIFLLIGALSGFFIVPLNALLQHRGHLLIGAGHSIAVQNFNENIGILLLSGTYTWMVREEFSINTIIILLGLFVSVTMLAIYKHYKKII
ncbi:lysophospholipid transporter LplT [Candidatus Methylopumilus universalis]|jgi:MFS family permease|uniref:Lysophospholipid transporter LplT n=1 Tax=Candidatus Methylopumilus universalis TaxID=2588536 RepID=A0AAX1F0H4_9PROT|nr:lysophospholipid transporter LplT [Candidatus Methylopumilus universalis]MCF8183228.1 lysophospholipid transporter LplT [Limnohabitans sp.]QDC41515.1 lysophospholipid transporter LplT [Candidatus Methylopumilus universalis]QDC42796.1 lysophospholipid transporter LplT [Candidatus Methylopumilus universalis]QDC47803.1 lysophospholipid transporter LplT [Candidatus Methylopumilus universalis]QDC55185.1 lysophospholipid transporter LplT [Candidatus Methylopumilus universalis]